jgi:hypothetical protein
LDYGTSTPIISNIVTHITGFFHWGICFCDKPVYMVEAGDMTPHPSLETDFMSNPDNACVNVSAQEKDAFLSTHQREMDVAHRICLCCINYTPCREFGLAHPEEEGVLGGLSQRARKRISSGEQRDDKRI